MRYYRQKTHLPKNTEIKRDWYLADAAGAKLGRLASRVAVLIIGKHKRDYTPHFDMGDYVVVINADKLDLSEKKQEEKVYKRFTGYLGNMKRVTLKEKLATDPSWIIKNAVNGMVHENRLKSAKMLRLRVFRNEKHPYEKKVKFKKIDIKKN